MTGSNRRSQAAGPWPTRSAAAQHWRRPPAGHRGNARAELHRVAAFLQPLHTSGRALRTCSQDDLDTWFAGPAVRWQARPFLVWAAARKHLPRPLTIPASPSRALRPMLDTDGRWVIARRLVTDDTIDVADRVAAALVVLYGQPLARVAGLKTSHIHRGPGGTTIVSLDGNPVPSTSRSPP